MADVVIVGGGVAGVACAHALAPDHGIVLLERDRIAGDTTSRASGVITLPLEPVPPAVRDHATAFFREFDGTGVFSFVERPTVRLVPPADLDGARERAGEGATLLEAADLEGRYPGVFADLSGYAAALEFRETGFIDPLEYVFSLKHEAERHGADFRTDVAVHEVLVEDGAVTGVETEHGVVEAAHVVCAAGWRTRALLSGLVAVPVRPLRWNAVVLGGDSDCAGYPMGSEPTMRLYWRPTRTGDLLVGGNEHLLGNPDDAPVAVDDGFRALVRERVPRLLCGLDGGRVLREDCCPTADTASPDGLPVVDAPPEAPDGLVVATGFHGRGVMLSPCTGAAVRSLVTGESAPFDLAPFALERFADRSADFEYVSHWA